MELNKYIDIQPEIAEALTENLPVVALESTILSHGMPYPENLDFAAEVARCAQRRRYPCHNGNSRRSGENRPYQG